MKSDARFGLLLAALFSVFASAALADSPKQVLAQLEREAGGAASSTRGEQLFRARSGAGEVESCTGCHTDNPKSVGQHARTHKAIQPLAPVANAERFTDPAKVEKWFKRNCKDVLARACTAQEKADFVGYMISVR